MKPKEYWAWFEVPGVLLLIVTIGFAYGIPAFLLGGKIEDGRTFTATVDRLNFVVTDGRYASAQGGFHYWVFLPNKERVSIWLPALMKPGTLVCVVESLNSKTKAVVQHSALHPGACLTTANNDRRKGFAALVAAQPNQSLQLTLYTAGRSATAKHPSVSSASELRR